MKKLLLTIAVVASVSLCANAQNTSESSLIEKEIKADINRAAGMFYARNTAKVPKDTPAPKGKKPFYINHYGCPGPFYLDKSEYYTETYAILSKADTLGKLTPLGKDVLRRVTMLRDDAYNRDGELTARGAQQSRTLVKQMIKRFPDMFTPQGYYSVRSTVDNRSIMTMEEGLLQLSAMLQPIVARSKASLQERRFMDPIDKQLTNQRLDSLTRISYDRFTLLNSNDARLMQSLFNDQNYVLHNVDFFKLAKQLFILAGNVQHSEIADKITLFDIFTPDELHLHWRKQNAWHYINYGGCTLNGGYQAYLQRSTLRNMIHMGDSVLKRNNPLMHLRYTTSQVIMSLACLMDINGYGLHTANLDSLEDYGWANYRIAPLGGSIMMLHYRTDRNDNDVLVKVLLNGEEARLPIQTDCAPYYHWRDVKRYYLRKLYRYENRRANIKKSK